ncbi:restriction endonuclease subunit S [Klebsiella quasipneumoniae]
MIVPKLRFKGFNEPWSETSLGKISSFITSGSRDWAQYYADGGDKFIRMTNLVRDGITLNLSDLKFVRLPENSNEGKRTALQHHDILISITAELGKLGWVPDDLGTAYINQHTALVRPNLSIVSSKFIANLLSTKKYNNILNQQNDSGAKSGLNLSTIKNFGFYATNKIEQTKIADFLSSVDEKIALLSKQHDLLCRYKKGMMQKIFSQELRFKDDSGDEFPEWEEVELKKIASKVNTKNRDNSVTAVLTNSATQGIVNQESYFEREIVTESNLTGYYVVRTGDFVYNPRISSTAPVGPIKMNELTQGVMSPLYTVFRFEKGLLKFYQYFFESSVWHDYMKSVANSGARHDRMNISGADFFGLPVPQPFEAEQTKIANFLSALDNKIVVKKAELDKLKTWKQGLLQQMFV